MTKLRPSERMLIIGKTQSGKSTLATQLAGGWSRVLVYDPKHDPGAVPPGATVRYGVASALAALPGRVVYRPLPREQGRVAEHFDLLVQRVLASGGAHGIVIHELRDVSPSSGSGTFLSAAYRQGASQRVPMILCTQRPVWIDVSAVSEAEHFALFQLQFPSDLTLVSKLFALDPAALSVDKPAYHFHHRGPDGVVRLMPPIRLRPAAVELDPTDESSDGDGTRQPDRRRTPHLWNARRR